MAHLILHKDGAYNIFSTISDAPLFLRAMTLDDLRDYIKHDAGERGLRELPDRLARAHATGCSALSGMTLEDAATCNRAGPGEVRVPFDEFVKRFLTLPAPDATGGA